MLDFFDDISNDIFPDMEHFTLVFKHDINMFFCYVRMHFYKLLAVITAEKRIKKWLIIKNLTINKKQIVGTI